MTIDRTKASMVGRAAALAVTLLASSVPAVAQERDTFCVSCFAEAEAEGFYAAALITESEDWVEIWNDDSEGRPPLNVRDRPYFLGETATLLTIFSNPATRGCTMDVRCDYTITAPNGDVKTVGPEPCITGLICGSTGGQFLSDTVRVFEVEKGDASGLWAYEIGVTDMVRGVRIPLHVALTVDAMREAPEQ